MANFEAYLQKFFAQALNLLHVGDWHSGHSKMSLDRGTSDVCLHVISLLSLNFNALN